jgi:hypothetical protein
MKCKAIQVHAIKAYVGGGAGKYSSIYSYCRPHTKVSGQLHAQIALAPGERTEGAP